MGFRGGEVAKKNSASKAGRAAAPKGKAAKAQGRTAASRKPVQAAKTARASAKPAKIVERARIGTSKAPGPKPPARIERPPVLAAKVAPTPKPAAPAAARPGGIVPAAAPSPGTQTSMLRKSRIPPRLTIRSPVGADELKAKIGALSTATQQIRALKRGLSRSFYEIGTILVDIRDRRLYEAKGYGSFDAFVEREIELGKQMSLRLVRIVSTFIKEAALSAGLDRASAAVACLDGDADPAQPSAPQTPSTAGLMRSPIPFHKQ
jgi:hypothetical protein